MNALLRDALDRRSTSSLPTEEDLALEAVKHACRRVAVAEKELALKPRSEHLQRAVDRRVKEMRVAAVKFSEAEEETGRRKRAGSAELGVGEMGR